MDKQDIRRQLYQIAEEEIPDVNLLPDVQKQLKHQSPPSTRMVFKLARAGVVFVLLLTVSAVLGYAYYQNTQIPSTIPENLVTELNLQQTIDDMTVTLNWAYADEHRMALEISSTYDANITAKGNSQDVRLELADGTFIPPAFGGGGGGGGFQEGDSMLMTNSFMSSYDMSVLNITSETADFILTVRYHYEEMPPAPESPAGGSGGGGGGGGNASPNAETVPESEAPTREFVFEFSLPLLPARDGNVAEATQTSAENTVTIDNVRITPSMTVFDLCSPLFAEGWLADVILQSDEPLPDYLQDVQMATTLDGTVVYPANRSGVFHAVEQDDCRTMTVPAPFSAESGQLTITVNKFYRYLEDDTIEAIESDVAYFAEQGFDLSYDIVEPPVNGGAGNAVVIPLSTGEMLIFTVESYPDAITQPVANSYIGSNSLQERITGDWVFTVTVE